VREPQDEHIAEREIRIVSGLKRSVWFWRLCQTHNISTGTIAIAWSPSTPSSVSIFPEM